MDPKSLFSLSDHLEALSKEGDPLEVLQETVDFEYFRAWLVEGLGYGDGAKGGRPPFNPVMMFKALILQAQMSGRLWMPRWCRRQDSGTPRVNAKRSSRAKAPEISGACQ